MNLLEIARIALNKSNDDPGHPFRFFQLATHGTYPEVRTIVKRKSDDDFKLSFFTDARSPKVEQIRQNDKVSAHFYDHQQKLQIRITGRAQLVSEGPVFDAFLAQVKLTEALQDYSSMQAPGQAVKDQSVISFGEGVHFLLVNIHPEKLDILQLGVGSTYSSSILSSGWYLARRNLGPLILFHLLLLPRVLLLFNFPTSLHFQSRLLLTRRTSG